MASREVIQSSLDQWEVATDNQLRAELGIHGLFPSDIVSKDILINMLVNVYFGEESG